MTSGYVAVRVLIVEPKSEIRNQMVHLIQRVGLAAEGFERAAPMLAALEEIPSACVVSEMFLPDMTGLRLIEMLGHERADVPVILTTESTDVTTAVEVMKRGAFDICSKPIRETVLLDRVHQAITLAAERSQRCQHEKQVMDRMNTLSQREHEVMQMVVEGLANKQIAYELKLSEKTVEGHRARVMRKMQAGSIAQLVHMCMSVQVLAAAS